MKRMSSLLLTASLLIAQGALASTPSLPSIANQHAHQIYVEGSGGSTLYYAGVFSSHENYQTAGLKGYGWNGNIGYNFTNVTAIEGGFMQNYANQTYSDDGIKHQQTLHANLPYISARFNVPLGHHFTFIAKTGAMYAYTSIKRGPDQDHPVAKTETDGMVLPYVGLGVGYSVNKHIEITSQYQGAVYGIAGAGLLSGGMTYHF